jgi:hypothetical protein
MTDEKIYSAKQVATRIGTDAKTLRKFFRSSASPYDAVGQGGRYEFPASMLAEVKTAFDKWNSGKTPSTPQPNSTPKATRARKTKGAKIDREPRDHRGLPYVPVRETRLNKLEFKGLRDQHGKARDKEYGTINGEEVKGDEDQD